MFLKAPIYTAWSVTAMKSSGRDIWWVVPKWAEIAYAALERLHVVAAPPRDAASALAHVLCNVLCTPGVRLRAGYLMAHLFPGPKHLVTKYPYRHPGWTFCAHIWRATRALCRVLLSPGCAVVAAVRTVTR